MKFILSLGLLILVHTAALAQNTKLDQITSLSSNNVTLEQALQKLEDNLKVKFSFVVSDVDQKKQVNTLNEATLEQHLREILGDHFEFQIKGNKILIRKLNEGTEPLLISGYVRDAETGEELIGATIANPSGTIGTVTNVYGFYSLRVPSGKDTLQCSYIGYKTITQKINSSTDQPINFDLTSDQLLLSEVVIEADLQSDNVDVVQMSAHKLSAKKIKEMPAFLGEVDVIKSITMLPGVTSVGEGASGFNVRGGTVDQNLVLLDEAPVYNTSHLLGFFSVFNADAIKDVQLYKGGTPSKYGGRVSSVLDVRQKEGNMKGIHGKAGIGLVSSRVMLEGPIVKDKSSFLIAGRRTYADLLYRTVRPANEDVSIYFYDLNTKLNYRFNDKNRLFLSGYFGNDVANLDEEAKIKWGNLTSTLRWTHIFNPALFFNTSLIYSQYNYQFEFKGDTENTLWESKITNYHFKPEFTWFANSKNTIDFGAQVTLFNFNPGEISITNNSSEGFKVPEEKAIELGIYAGNEQKVGENLTLKYGLRYSRYHFLGPLEVSNYNPNLPREEENVIDTTRFGKNENIITFDGWEPRFSAAYKLGESASVKASYQRMYQYQQLVSNSTSATPFDVWKSTGPHISPLSSHQVALGYFKNFKKKGFEVSVEAYYKTMENVIDYKNGANLFLSENIETELLTGNGRAYGAEFFLEKKRGKFNGWLAYTVGRTERQVKGDSPTNSINNGEYYPSDYDKTHDVSLVLSYTISPRLSINVNFLYATGRPATYPDGRYQFEGIALPNYSSRNNERLPDYHRADLSATLKERTKGRRWSGSWTFSVYNLYARKNAYSIAFKPEQKSQNSFSTKAKQLSILGSVFPSITYNFEF